MSAIYNQECTQVNTSDW